MLAHVAKDQNNDPGDRITTPRLVLRAPENTDVEALVAIGNNPRIAENTASLPHPYGKADARAWLERMRSKPSGKGRGFVVCLRDTRETLIGCAGWGDVPGLDLPQIGYWIGETYWNRGFATEAAHAVIDHAFTIGKLDRVGCGCRVTNAASRRVIEKCGFQYDGFGLVHFRSHGGSLPVSKYQMDRTAWASLKAWGAQ